MEKKPVFTTLRSLPVNMNLIFMCDSGNASIRVNDIAGLVSRKKTAPTLEEIPIESQEREDDIPIASKYSVTSTLALISTPQRRCGGPSAYVVADDSCKIILTFMSVTRSKEKYPRSQMLNYKISAVEDFGKFTQQIQVMAAFIQW